MNGRNVLSRRTLVKGFLLSGGVALAGFGLAGCNQSSPGRDAGTTTSTAAGDTAGNALSVDPTRALVAYFTCPEPTGTDTVAGASRVVRDGVLFGNVELIATLIQQRTGADMFAIQTVQEYPADHDELISFAVSEMDAGTLPELTENITDVSAYNTVFLGYPIWNAQLPMPVRTLLDTCDFSGKTIVAFTVHGGSGFGGTISQIEAAEPEATVVEGFSVSRTAVDKADADLNAWLDSILA